MPERQYTEEEIKEDVKSFFTDVNHWAFDYGTPTPLCGPDSPYHRKQIEVIFESEYPHWATNRAVGALIDEGFLRQRVVQIPNLELYFVYRRGIRYIARAINQRSELVRRYSDPSVSEATGGQAEIWFLFLFKSNSFDVVGRNTKEYRGIQWTKTEHDLDFIVEKDGISYGVEVKNTLPYMEDDEFNIKVEMCEYFGIRSLFALRYAPYSQIERVAGQLGLILIFKSKIFPPGHQHLVTNIWNFMRLPVSVWKDFPPKLEQIFLSYHDRCIKE